MLPALQSKADQAPSKATEAKAWPPREEQRGAEWGKDLYNLYRIYINLFEGSLEVKLPTIWTDEKQSWAEAERRGE